MCKNCVTHGSWRANDPTGYLVGLDCADIRKLDIASDSDIWEKLDILKDAQECMNIGQFRDLEQALGMKYNANGLLALSSNGSGHLCCKEIAKEGNRTARDGPFHGQRE